MRNESVLVGIVSPSQKASLAASAFFLGLLLEGIGYAAGGDQSRQTLDGLRDVMALIPAGTILLAAACIAFYPISAASYRRMMAALGRTGRTDSAPLP